jgi:hypothetical protein
VGVSKSHPLHGQRRGVKIIVPASAASRDLISTRIAGADLRGVIPRVLEAGIAAPLSVVVEVHGGLWNTGVIGSDYPGPWHFSFMCGHAWDFKPLDPMTEQACQTMDRRRRSHCTARLPSTAAMTTRAQTEALAMQISTPRPGRNGVDAVRRLHGSRRQKTVRSF